ncbi:MAG: hypothetical protein ACRDHY_17275, partial [Anaerolineales bacterium]
AWSARWNQAEGAYLTLDQIGRLARAWYGEDRRSRTWRRKTKDEARAVFEDLGLFSAFWQL